MSWYRRVWNVLRPGRVQRNLERELSFHMLERAEELQAGGLSEEASVRQARLLFGNYTSQVERTREMDLNGLLESAFRNLHVALRTLAKSPGFSAVVIVTLALGIGANSAVFSAIDAVILRALPFPHADRLVKMSQSKSKAQSPFVAPVRLEEWNRLNGTFQGISGYYTEDESELSGELPEKLKRALVAPRFLQVLGVAPEVGRDFTPQEEHFGGPDAILISHRLWLRRFAGNPNAVGRTLRIGRSSVPIIGVMPASFLFPTRDVDLWSVSPPDAPYAQSRESTWFVVTGRMKPGITLEQARANLAAVQADLGRQFPKTDADMSVIIEPLKEVTIGGVRQSLWIVFGSVSLLLLIACTNIAALLLSRASGRRHEISVRFSLGASRTSVATQLLTEVLVLSLAGAAMGLLLAGGASRVFRALAKDLPRIEEIGLDWRIVLYTLACALIATLLSGLFPAILGTRRSLSSSLAQASRSQVSARNPIQFVLVGVQVALAVMLLCGAGLLIRSFEELGRVSPGFDPGHVLTGHISTSWGETNDFPAAQQRANRLLEALNTVPGVASSATALSLPGVPFSYQVEMNTVEGRAPSDPKMLAESRQASPSYFATMRIPLLAGEICRDDLVNSTVMVNRSFANAYLGGSAAIGRRIFQPGNTFIRPSEVRGIVGDARESGMDHEPAPTVYWCFGAMQPGTFFLVRTKVEPAAMIETIRRKVHEIEPRRSVYDLTPLNAQISDSFAENRLRTILLAFFAVTAMLLACVGLYGTLSYLVSVRQREVGLRLALGAMRKQIVRQFLTHGLRAALLGCIAGLALAEASGRLLSGMLYGVTPSDLPTLAGVVGIIVAVSVLASLLPSIRAARLQPMQVLREG
ncbi:MAG TPA: ABC transporter permease [Bryobacteraceae bacterium]|nr:ABC transporter permease [Bryobacteraceae bacterium]